MEPKKARVAKSKSTKSLADGIKCLQWILNQKGPIGVQELAEGLEFEPTRAFRLLRTLLQEGLLRQTHGRKYEIGPATYSLTAQALHNSHFVEAALPPLEELRRSLPFRVAMGTLWKRKVSYMYNAAPRAPIEKAIGGAPQWEATNSGIGLAALAHQSNEDIVELYEGSAIPNYPEGVCALLERLDEIRALGYCYTSIAGSGRQGTQYTLAVTLPSNGTTAVALAGRIGPSDVPTLVEHLYTAAVKIEEGLRPPEKLNPLKLLKQRHTRTLL